MSCFESVNLVVLILALMISEVCKIYIQDRIIGICVAYPTRVRFGLTHCIVFLKK